MEHLGDHEKNVEQVLLEVAKGLLSQPLINELYSKSHIGDDTEKFASNGVVISISIDVGVRNEEIYDSFTGHIQMVYRHSSLAENWCLCDDVIVNEERSLQTLDWQKGHGKPRR